MAQAFLVWRKNGILYKQCFGDCRGGALLHSPSFIAVSCLSTDDCFAVLLNRYKILYLTSSGLAPTGELRGCLVSPLRIRPRGEGSICGGRTLGVALPCHPSCLSRACSKTDRFLLRRYPGLRAPLLAPVVNRDVSESRRAGGALATTALKGSSSVSAQPQKTRGRRAIYQGSRMSAAPLRVVVDGEPKSDTKALT